MKCTRARVYLRDSAAFGGHPAHTLVAEAFGDAGTEAVSVNHGIVGFDRSSGVLSAPFALPRGPVRGRGHREEIEAALPRVREVVERGPITLTQVELYETETGATNPPEAPP